MLIRFNVKNFLSFSERENGMSEEFSMIAGKVRNKKEHIYENEMIKLLKFAAIYGANASGKSNLVKALDFMRHTVLYGLPNGHTNQYCKIEENNKNKESYFEIEIMINEKYYSYGFEVILNQSKFISEWLVELTGNNHEKLIFSRDIANKKYELGNEFTEKALKTRLSVYADDIKEDESVLLLSIMNQNKKSLYQNRSELSIFQDVYNWLDDTLDIKYPDSLSNYEYLARTDKVKEVCRVIAAFGTGITGFELVDVPVEKVIGNLPLSIKERLRRDLENQMSEMRNNSRMSGFGFCMRSPEEFFILSCDRSEEIQCKTIQFSHGKENVLFDIGEESDGTKRILDLLEILLANENKTYVIDELDRCLHPSLTYKFVQTYLELLKKKNIQLIVTTHESRLLDFDLLRRDEVWFVNKRITGASDIYSLEEYNTRFDQKIDKAYLEGRYGGVPVFTTIFPIE